MMFADASQPTADFADALLRNPKCLSKGCHAAQDFFEEVSIAKTWSPKPKQIGDFPWLSHTFLLEHLTKWPT